VAHGKNFNKIPRLAISVLVAALVQVPACFASLCSEPPFISASVVPNVLMVIDNSASMYDLAYVGDNFATSFCYDNSYESPFDSYNKVPGKTYYGYYEPESWYIYNTENPSFEKTFSTPTGCSNTEESNSDYCIKVSEQEDNLVLSSAAFRGNVLNWLTMSKLDIEKKVLTGGKYDGTELCGESRGCIGRRFFKQVKGWKRHGNSENFDHVDSGFVFAVRGVPPPEPDTTGTESATYFELSPGGQTVIEIYQLDDVDELVDNCTTAITCFTLNDAEPFGQCKKAINGCMGYDLDTGSPKKHSQSMGAFVHSLLTCYGMAKRGNQTVNSGDIQSIQSICKGIYARANSDNLDWTLDDDKELNDPFNPSFVCSRFQTADGQTKVGIGWCYQGDGVNHIWADPEDFDDDELKDSDDAADCVEHQLVSFCVPKEIPPPTGSMPLDPSEQMSFDGSYLYSYVPAMIIEAGFFSQLTNDRDPIGELQNRLSTDPPEGLLQKVKSKVKLGLMETNKYGSKSELTADERKAFGCKGEEDLDGGKLSVAIGLYTEEDNNPIIKGINEVTAGNWTPLGETLYEVTRYFRGMASAYDTTKSYDGQSPVGDFCQGNYVVVISDGNSTRDKHLPSDEHFNAETTLTNLNLAYDYNSNLFMDGTPYAIAVAYWAHMFQGNWDEDHAQPDQPIDFYSVFALGGSSTGRQLLRDIAKYGGFSDSNEEGDPKNNGLPDSGEWDGRNFVEAENGIELETTITRIFYEIAAVGAAGAVATVTQQVDSDDILVRGGFETTGESEESEPSEAEDLPAEWKGHLEVYLPYDGCSIYGNPDECQATTGCSWSNGCTGEIYSFQESDNSNEFCGEDEPADHCWDAGKKIPAHSSRNIFTFIDDPGDAQGDKPVKVWFTAANAAILHPYLENAIDFHG